MAKKRFKLAEVRDRWTDEQSKRIGDLLFAGALTPEECGVVDRDGVALLDLRGIHLLKYFYHVDVSDVDFSFAFIEAGFAGFCSTVKRCSFLRAEMPGAIVHERFEDCDFSYADCRNANMAGSAFERCSFENANLKKTWFPATTFLDCSFVNANLQNTHLGETTFIRCQFEGARFGGSMPTGLSTVRFISCTPNRDEIDWGTCDPAEATFEE